MEKSVWRTPNEDEKNRIMLWAEKDRRSNIRFPLVCLIVLVIGFMIGIIAAVIHHQPFIPLLIIGGIIFIILVVFNVMNCLTENAKVKQISDGEARIVDAQIKSVKLKSLGRHTYYKVVTASYYDGQSTKTTDFVVSKKMFKVAQTCKSGIVVRFAEDSPIKRHLLFIPNEKHK